MKNLKLYDSTLIVVVSDHGETFGEHRLLGHGRALYEELISVPLIVKYTLPHTRSRVIHHRVSIASIMPTILEYLELLVPKNVEYQNLDTEDQMCVAEIFRDMLWIVNYGVRV